MGAKLFANKEMNESMLTGSGILLFEGCPCSDEQCCEAMI